MYFLKNIFRVVMMMTAILFTLGCETDSPTRFTLLDASDTGVDFANTVTANEYDNVLNYGYFYNGGGVAAGDFNGDGLIDLYFTGNQVADRLYLNQGAMRFADATEASGIAHGGWKTGVSVVDINSDGHLDLYVCRSGAEDPTLRRNLLYINDGKAHFTESAEAYGLADESYTTQAAFFDYDRDGDLDAFLLNHSVQEYAGFSNLIASFRTKTDARYGSKLLRNDAGKYTDVTETSGMVSNVLSFGLGLNVSDLNDDGWLDLYVTNDYNENDYLYLNQQNGTFKEVVRDAMGHTSFYSMGTDAADINNDGRTDLITLDMLPESNERIKLTAGDDNYDKYQMLLKAGFHEQTMRNMLQLNAGNSRSTATGNIDLPVFSEIGQLSGISNTDWSWSALLADFDNDGFKDLFVTNGYARDYTNMQFLKYSMETQMAVSSGQKTMPSTLEYIASMPTIDQPNQIFRNMDGLSFEKKTEAWGFAKNSQSNGAIYADLDNDGDLDLVTNNVDEVASVYQNNGLESTGRNYVQIGLSAPSEAFKIGARVTVWAGGQAYYQEFQPVRGFQSAMYGPLHFGLGESNAADSIEVRWNDGTLNKTRKPMPSGVHLVMYDKAGKNVRSQTAPPLFSASTPFFTHRQPDVNDFRTQSLLPAMQSYNGPCMATSESAQSTELFIGGGRGQAGGYFVSANGQLRQVPQPALEADAAFEDGAAVFVDVDGDGDQDLVVASAGYALSPEDPLLEVRLYSNNNGRLTRAPLPKMLLNATVVCAADVDLDGDQDLFIGAGCAPGRYPEAQRSILLKNDGSGVFTNVDDFPAVQALVTGASFTDLNGNRSPDLVLVGEWMKPIALINRKGNYSLDAATTTSLPSAMHYALAAADLDGDGDEDFLVGGLGANNQYAVNAGEGLTLDYGDYGGNSRMLPLLGLKQFGNRYPFASLDELLGQIPALKKNYADYESYARANMEDILAQLPAGKTLTADDLRTGVLWNDKGKLTFEPLPTAAQYSPVHAVLVRDFNGDKKPDVLLAGNELHSRVRLGRSDASYGQLFRNQGDRKFQYLSQNDTGIWVKGAVRSVAWAGNRLVFGVNGGEAKVYKFKSELQ